MTELLDYLAWGQNPKKLTCNSRGGPPGSRERSIQAGGQPKNVKHLKIIDNPEASQFTSKISK